MHPTFRKRHLTPDEAEVMFWYLDQRLFSEFEPHQNSEMTTREMLLGIAYHEADHGDATRLKKMFPEIAKFITPRRKRKDKTLRKDGVTNADKVVLAYADAARIREIWRELYGTHRLVPKATYYAARIWGSDLTVRKREKGRNIQQITEADLERYKPRGKKPKALPPT